MTNRLSLLYQLLRHFGLRWLAFRLGYTLRLRSGVLQRRTPMQEWDDQPLRVWLADPALADPDAYLAWRHTRTGFFFRPSDLDRFGTCFSRWDSQGVSPVVTAGEIDHGLFRYFEHVPLSMGLPPSWYDNPFTGQQVPAGRHWSEIPDMAYGDIKAIWELGRFAFTYTLVRAYWRTHDDRFAELFWQLVEDWRAQNPPQQGPHWKCGQETSFRVMACCFGLYGFLNSSATTAARVVALAEMLAVSGARIEANLGYALSQRNNHGISEGMRLWTIGTLFPELCSAPKWERLGRDVLERQGRELIYDDGAFAQHSVNYHRLMLHDYLWVLRLAELNRRPFSAELAQRFENASSFLYQLQDDESGRVPCYGANDGSLILPLNNCDYQDFRPVLQASHYLRRGTRCYAAGPWDEDLLWLFGPDAVDAPQVSVDRIDLRADQGGYYTLRTEESFAFVRCPVFRHRPGQADILHLDLWWRGQNIAMDAGTFSYNAPAPWDGPFFHTAFHNTITVDARDQMDRRGRFLWLPWLQGRVNAFTHSSSGQLAYWEGQHNGYKRLNPPALHQRGILRIAEGWWFVLDALSSAGDHEYRLHWLLPDVPYDLDSDGGHLKLETEKGRYYLKLGTLFARASLSLLRADLNSPRGWRSPYYYQREPALSLACEVKTSTIYFWTLFGPGGSHVETSSEAVGIRTDDWCAQIECNSAGAPLITRVQVSGALQDELKVAR